ncbi:MAG: DUF4294 domain-containing protein [Bacteroidota bacterium]|nr:DUF4294 domain-containing protein [Bacteroidota bacterium]
MLRILCTCVLFVFSNIIQAQIYKDSLEVITKDTLYVIEDVYITDASPEEIEARKQYAILKRRVYRTYPYAHIAAERLELLNQNLQKLKNKRERKKYLKITEKYIENEFEEQLKKLSRKDGQILVKLIHRQTGSSTYDLVKNLKSNWSAYWYGKTAKLFNINLKTTYQPFDIREDFWIEDILIDAFEQRRLPEQKPKINIDTELLYEKWQQ